MSFLTAGETVYKRASAGNFFDAEVRVLRCVRAAWKRAPTILLIQKDKLINTNFSIVCNSSFVAFDILIYHRLRDLEHAAKLRTRHFDLAVQYLADKVVLPAVDAKRMPAE
jgi:hypothetical protein